MSYINEARNTMWTEWFKNNFGSVDFTTAREVRMYAFTRVPEFTEESSLRVVDLTGVSGLLALPEWVQTRATTAFTNNGTGATAYLKRTTNASDNPLFLVNNSGVKQYVGSDNGWTFSRVGGVQEVVAGVAFYLQGTYSGVVNPIVCVTTAGCGVNTVIHDDAIYGVADEFTAGSDDWLLTVSNSDTAFSAAALLLRPGLPPWESAHAQHLWLEPQRTNFIANPAFQNASVFGWRANSGSTLSRVVGGEKTWRTTHYCAEVRDTDQAYVSFPGASGAYVSAPDNDAYTLTNLEIVARVRLVDWTPSTPPVIMSLFKSDPNRNWRLYINTSGQMVFEYTPTGLNSGIRTRTSTAPGFVDAVTYWVKVTLEDNVGGLNRTSFYWAADAQVEPTSWTAVGSSTTGASFGGFPNIVSTLELGSNEAGVSNRLNGRIYFAALRNGVDGTTVAEFNPDEDALIGNTEFLSSTTGETWTINGAAVLNTLSSETKVMESNYFPNVNEWYSGSFSISAKSLSTDGVAIRYGLVAFDPAYAEPKFIASDFVLLSKEGTPSSGFVRLPFLCRVPADVPELCFRLEVSNSKRFWVSNVLVDPHEGQYSYFDGSSPLGADGDFRWMGGENDQHFSVWYNNYKNVSNRLLGVYDSLDGVYKSGLVEEWCPDGSTIQAHWDAVTAFTPLNWRGDAYYTLKNVNGTAVTLIDSEYNFDLSPKTDPVNSPYVQDEDILLILDENNAFLS